MSNTNIIYTKAGPMVAADNSEEESDLPSCSEDEEDELTAQKLHTSMLRDYIALTNNVGVERKRKESKDDDDEDEEEIRRRPKRVKRTTTQPEYENEPEPSFDSTGPDSEWYIENDPEEDKDANASHWKPVLAPFKKHLMRLLEPDESVSESEDPDNCIGCKYTDGNNKRWNGIKWNQLIDMFTKRTLDTDIVNLGSELYKVFMRTVLLKDEYDYGSLSRNVRWSAYGLIYHFLYHHPCPELCTLIRLWEVKWAIKTIYNTSLFIRHDRSGRIKVNNDNVKPYIELMKMEQQLYRNKVGQMMFRNSNRALQYKNGYSIVNPTLGKRSIHGIVKPHLSFGQL